MGNKAHIVVVGGGFAGLAAAYELINSGFAVTLLEARRRVGGRVWSTQLANRATVELGGEWISSGDQSLIALAERFDLPLVQLGVDFRIREVIDGPVVAPEEQRKAHRIASETLASMDIRIISKSTIADFLDQLPLTEPQASLLRGRLQGSFGADLNEIALRMLGDYSLGESGKFYRVAAGNQSIANALADRVPDIRLGHAVGSVAHHQTGVSLRGEAAGGPFTIEADAVVLAIPVSRMAELEFDSALPEATVKAISALRMGVAGKLAIGTRGSPPLRAMQDVEAPYWCWTGNGAAGVPRSAVTAFCGSVHAQRILATNSGDPSIWLNKLQSAMPAVAYVTEAVMVDWSQDKWARGCYSAFDHEATDLIPFLSLPVGRIFFAGEHTAVMSGTMDGALTSGLDAARQISEVLR